MRKLVSIITLICFFLTSCLGEVFVGVCQAEGLARSVIAPVSAYEQFGIETFTLPRNLGEIKDTWKSVDLSRDQGRAIIHIQDAHCNYDAQKKISDIIEYLHNNYGVNTINLEGGEGAYNLSTFTGIKDKTVREKVADYFVRQGLVNGAEYYAINNEANGVNLWGIEDTNLYLENLNVYRDFLKHKQDSELYLKQIESVLNSLKKNIYSDELLEFDAQYVQYKENDLELKDYIAYLSREARGKDIDTKAFPNVYRLAKSLEEEENIDFKRADKEREILIDELAKHLSKNSLTELIEKTAEFKKEEEPDELFYDFLIQKAKTVNISIKRFPELKKYVRYITFYNAMDKICLFEEIERLEDGIKESMYETGGQRELNQLSKTLVLTKNLFNIQLSKKDYEYYKTHQADFKVEKYLSFIKREAAPNKINVKLSPNLHKLDKWRENLSQFYECSTKRDRAFIRNLALNPVVQPRRMERAQPTRMNSQAPFTILITGGFHTENLSALFKSNNISYVTIMPNFKNGKDYESQYFNLLSGKQLETFKALVAETSNLALYTDFCEHVVKVYSLDELEAKDLWRQLAQAVFEEQKDITIRGRQYSFHTIDAVEPIKGLEIDGKQVYAKNIEVNVDEVSQIGKQAGAWMTTLQFNDDRSEAEVAVHEPDTKDKKGGFLGKLKLKKEHIDPIMFTQENINDMQLKGSAHRQLVNEILSLFELSPPEFYTFDILIKDLFGFASAKHKYSLILPPYNINYKPKLIALHENFARDPIAVLHEICELAVKIGLLNLKLENNALTVSIKHGKEFRLLLEGETLAIAQKAPDNPHYLLRAMTREVFGDRDRRLTTEIKQLQKKENPIKKSLEKKTPKNISLKALYYFGLPVILVALLFLYPLFDYFVKPPGHLNNSNALIESLKPQDLTPGTRDFDIPYGEGDVVEGDYATVEFLVEQLPIREGMLHITREGMYHPDPTEFAPSTAGVPVGITRAVINSETGKIEIGIGVATVIARLSGNIAEDMFITGYFNDIRNGKISRRGDISIYPRGEETTEEVSVKKITLPPLKEGQRMQLPIILNGRVIPVDFKNAGISIDERGLLTAKYRTKLPIRIRYVIKKMTKNSDIKCDMSI
ncbi:MAG: hypothetical protein D4S01_01890 [Dehalococcoidia bacterium]|nr:MAG: hypothetical protein D4S01_01890 [Dehalococcoidia bacterium]